MCQRYCFFWTPCYSPSPPPLPRSCSVREVTSYLPCVPSSLLDRLCTSSFCLVCPVLPAVDDNQGLVCQYTLRANAAVPFRYTFVAYKIKINFLLLCQSCENCLNLAGIPAGFQKEFVFHHFLSSDHALL